MAWSRRPRSGAENASKTTQDRSFGADGLQAPAQHYRRTDAVLGSEFPAGEGDFPAEESFLHLYRTGSLSSSSKRPTTGIVAFSFRNQNGRPPISGKPLHLDISDLPMKSSVITANRNKFVLGWFGLRQNRSLMNHMLRQYWEQGAHILLVDTGNSYQGPLLADSREMTRRPATASTRPTPRRIPSSFNPFYHRRCTSTTSRKTRIDQNADA